MARSSNAYTGGTQFVRWTALTTLTPPALISHLKIHDLDDNIDNLINLFGNLEQIGIINSN